MKLVTLALFLGCTATEAPKVAPPPAIVFDWLRNGNRDIYRAALDGRDVVRLTSNSGDDQHPTEAAGVISHSPRAKAWPPLDSPSKSRFVPGDSISSPSR